MFRTPPNFLPSETRLSPSKHTDMKEDTVASLYKHSGEQDQSRAKPKFQRCENTDRVMSKKKKKGGKKEKQSPREECFMRENGK